MNSAWKRGVAAKVGVIDSRSNELPTNAGSGGVKAGLRQ